MQGAAVFEVLTSARGFAGDLRPMLVDEKRDLRVEYIGGIEREQLDALVMFAGAWIVPFETEWRSLEDGEGVVRRLLGLGGSQYLKDRLGITAYMPTDPAEIAALRRIVLEACLALGISFWETGIDHPDGWSLLVDGEARYTLSDFGPYFQTKPQSI